MIIWIFLIFYGSIIYPNNGQKSINIGLTNIIPYYEHFKMFLNLHLNSSQCYKTTNYNVTLIPFNTTPVNQSPLNLNKVDSMDIIFGQQIFYGPTFYGFTPKSKLFKFTTSHIDLFNMNILLRHKIIMAVVNETTKTDTNKTLMVIVNATRVNLMRPWEEVNFHQYFAGFAGLIRIYRYNVSADADIIATEIKANNIYNIVLDLNWVGTRNVLLACKNRNLLSWKYRWMVFFSSFSSLFEKGGLNIPYSQNFTVYDFRKSCTSFLNDQISVEDERDMILGDITYSIVRLMDFQNCNKTMGDVVEMSTGDVQFATTGQIIRQNWFLEVYQNIDRFKVVGRVMVDPNENIRISQPAVTLKSFSRLEILAQMRSRPFRVAALIDSPLVNVNNGTLNESYPGFSVEMIRQILDSLQVPYEIKYYNISHGILVDNTRLTGILGMIQSGLADIAIGPITYNYKYRPFIDYTTQYKSFKLAIVYKQFNVDLYENMFQFINVFTWQVWLLIISCCLVYALGLTCINLISPNRVYFGFLDSFLFTVGSQVQGVTTALPDKISGRVLVVFWWIFNLIIVLTYVANYGALRTNTRLQASIQTLEDLTKQSAYTYGTLRESSVDDFLASSTSQYVQQINRILRSEFDADFVNYTTSAMDIVRRKKYAFIYHDWILEQFRPEKCLLLTNGFEQFFYALALEKDSDYTSIINEEINKLMQSTYLTQLTSKYNTTQITPECLPSNWLGNIFQFLGQNFVTNLEDSLKIQQTAGIFVIMLFGIIISLILAVIELIYRFMRRKFSNK